MKTLKDICAMARMNHKDILRFIKLGKVPGWTTETQAGKMTFRYWSDDAARATVDALAKYATHNASVPIEEQRRIAEQCVALRASGLTWERIYATLDHPYKCPSAIRNVYFRHGFDDTKDSEAIEAKREQISIEWANNPPPGSEHWSDAMWLRKIDERAFGRRCANQIHATEESDLDEGT